MIYYPDMNTILYIRLTIDNSNPAIYRDIQVKSQTSLEVMHEIIQATFEWSNLHSHYFKDSTGNIIKDKKGILIGSIITTSGSITYVYDYADSWGVRIEVLEARDIMDENFTPICTDGRRNSPPEESGGIVCYTDTLDMLQLHQNKEWRYPLIAEWLGEDYNPETFNMEAINSRLQNIII
jgi:hypothetical protein